MLQVEAAQTCFHRRLAVWRSPRRAQTTIRARPEAQGALALFVEQELVIDEMALATGPFRRFVVVDAGPDSVHGRQLVAARLLDGEEHLTAVRVEPVPRLPPAGAAARRPCRRRAAGPPGGGVQGPPRMDEFVRQAHFGARRLSPGRFADALAFDLVGIDKIADAAAETAQEQAG